MSTEKNLYEILEISESASSGAIKSAYRKLARKYHPDLNSGDASCIQKFKEITEAYEILSDNEKKKNYDLLKGFYKETSQKKYSQAEKAYKEDEEKSKKEKDENFSSIFNEILSGFKKTTSSSRKTYKTETKPPESGSDVNTEVTISTLEAIEGTVRTINILHTAICPNCEGRPFLNGTKCPLCSGKGEQTTHKKLNVKIPPNIKNGSKIRIANEGNKGYNGGRNGDLYLRIKVEDSSGFKYEGLNVFCTVPITPFEAVLGAEIKILSPNGKDKISMKIAPNTQNGQKLRLSGQGLKQNDKSGDMIVTVSIEIPKNPSEREIELYKELQKASDKDIREN